MTKLAVMQPYVFPYIGYFQLVHAVDIFVFYDDVNYIKGGWINRNRILLNGKDSFLTVPCSKASPNKQIREVEFEATRPEFQKILKTIFQAYKRAPYFEEAFPLVENILNTTVQNISELAIQSVVQIVRYLGLNKDFRISSLDFASTKGLDRADRLIAISKQTGVNQYINPIGGTELYNKKYFMKNGIQLNFIKSLPVVYKQFKNEFVPWLSIIDIIMFNSKEETRNLLNKYILE